MNLLGYETAILNRFGRDSAGGDDFVTSAKIRDAVNEAHRWLAEQARCYERTMTYDLPLGTDGVSVINLDADVIDVDRRRILVKIDVDGVLTWTRIGYFYETEEELAFEYGVDLLDNTTLGDPTAAFFRLGYQFQSHRQLVLYPGSDTAVTGGVKVREICYPDLMTEDTHVPALQPAEHQRLLYPALWKLAEMEMAEGRGSQALVANYQTLALRDAMELKMILMQFRAGGEW